MERRSKKAVDTSWQSQEKWYGNIVGKEGHHYHREVIFPKLLPFFKNKNKDGPLKILDLACGEGVLARQLLPETIYLGIDAAPSLISRARSLDANPNHRYLVKDLTKPIAKVDEGLFTYATIILALQNMADPSAVLKNCCSLLEKGGKVFVVLNHPCFRIPRQSSWGVDEEKKIQYRRIDRYLTSMEIPIQMHPGQKEISSVTTSFHWPLSRIFSFFYHSGFVVEGVEEWCSDKKSSGKKKAMEDRCRDEIPLFLAIIAIKA